MTHSYSFKDSYFRAATATPSVSIGNIASNSAHIAQLYSSAVKRHVSLVVFPELSLTGYSLGDTVRQSALLRCAEKEIVSLAYATKHTDTAMIIGLPILHDGHLYNCAAVLAKGTVQGIVTKSNLPNYGEFYEKRWYRPYHGTTMHTIADTNVPFGQNLLFSIGGVCVGVEVCEDMWVTDQPSRELAMAGALLIANPSASPELVGKSDYRRNLITMTSAVQRVAYIYAGADWNESTTDTVMSGHAVIAENGTVLAERAPFSVNKRLLIADIDIDHLQHDRMQDTTIAPSVPVTIINTGVRRRQSDCVRTIPQSYFLPATESTRERAARCDRIVRIQAHGLAARLQAANTQTAVIGVSGGLDSTLALLVAYEAAHILQKDVATYITALTMPGSASSARTQNNATQLAKILGITSVVIPIESIVSAEQAALTHDGNQDTTYENIQARARTALLFNYANSHGGLVVGTGDLSELALGWCTYGGDQLSHYNVNASIPKTLVKDLVRHAAQLSHFAKARSVLMDIIDTPISPELTHVTGQAISQETEQLIGPYVLHDFFIYHIIRYGDSPEKIYALAIRAFNNDYSAEEIYQWLQVLYRRFAHNQFKRSAMPDGPKVGSIALSPRGDWRMPSDMSSALWSGVFDVQ